MEANSNSHQDVGVNNNGFEHAKATTQVPVEQIRDCAIFMMDLEGTITSWNAGVEHIFGYTKAEFLGQHAAMIFTSTDRAVAAPEHELESARRYGQAEDERWHVRKDGSTFWASGIITAMYDSRGAIQNFCKVIRDATDRKQSELRLHEINAQLKAHINDLQQRTQELDMLGELTELLLACRTRVEAVRVLSTFIPSLFSGTPGMLGLVQNDSDLVEAIVTWNEPAIEPLFRIEDCWALRRGRTHWVDVTQPHLPCHHLHVSSFMSGVCVPIIGQGQVFGVLTLVTSQPGELNDAHTRLIHAVAGQVELSLANVQLQETLRNQSVRDPLTGLFNRRYMEESLARELRRAQRGSYPIGMLLLDIDHFKTFNDTFGHDAGDTVLRAVGHVLQTQIRREDVACRYGGEEFVLMLPGITLDTFRVRAEAVRAWVKQLIVPYRQPLGSVTVSIGAMFVNADSLTEMQVLTQTDAALYRAKRAGRDRVVFVDEIEAHVEG